MESTQSQPSKFSSSMKVSLWDGFFFSLMVGIGESYLPAFVLSQGMPEYVAGLFATVPLLVGASLQLFTPQILHQMRSVKSWVVFLVVLQALSFLPFVYFNFYPTENHALVFLFASIYWFAGFAIVPAWNLWMTEIVPQSRSASFFSYRQSVVQLGILVGLVVGGYLLQSRLLKEEVFWILFLIAFISRMASALCLLFQEPKRTHPGKYHLKDLFNIWSHQRTKRFLIFIFIFFIAISISSPFVTPYFLGKLQLNYTQYMYAIGALLVAKILTLPLASRLIHRFGEKNMLLFGALGMSPLPALWAFSDNYFFILFLQACSGIFWGFFEVALSLTFFNQISESRKMLVITAYSFFNSVAISVGSFLGAAVLKNWNHSFKSYYFVFIFGALLRTLIILGFIWKTRKEVHLLSEKDVK
jgi:predicted MFS family arabinose efflux permease